MTVVTPTDHPKSVNNRGVFEGFAGVFLCCQFVVINKFSIGIGPFVIGLRQISTFLSPET